MKIPLMGGAYVSRSVIAEAQRCLNLYPEANPGDAEVPVTHYPTPGLVSLLQGPAASGWRGFFVASNGVLFGVLGTKVYKIKNDWTVQELGTLVTDVHTPVSMADNGATLMIVDGSTHGYLVDLSTLAFSEIADPDFRGGNFVQYLDSYFVLNEPGTNVWYSSLSNSTDFDGLYYAAKNGSPDPIQAIRVVHREAWLVGVNTTEVWNTVGGASFPFAPLQGVFIQHGTAAKYSLAGWGLQLFWLSRDNNGQAIVVTGESYRARAISTPAIVSEFSKYATIDDAIGMVYQQDSHVFYLLTFPTANKTWVYDASIDQWHERCWLDDNGNENRHRVNCIAFAYGKVIGGDWQNGTIYELSLDAYSDAGKPIKRLRSFPHLVNEGARIEYISFVADMEVGTGGLVAGPDFMDDFGPDFGPSPVVESDPMVTLRWSDTRGKSWGNGVLQSMGKTGEFLAFPTWRRLGYARDRVFELSWSTKMKTALNGAYLEVNVEPKARAKPRG